MRGRARWRGGAAGDRGGGATGWRRWPSPKKSGATTWSSCGCRRHKEAQRRQPDQGIEARLQPLREAVVGLVPAHFLAELAQGEVLTAELVEDVFSLPCRIIDDPETGTPLVIPREGVWAE